MVKVEPKDAFEYGGMWIHASDSYAKRWRCKGKMCIPPAEAFHLELIILRALKVKGDEKE